MYSKIIALKDKLQKLKENRKNRQSDQTFHFSPFSKKQKQVLTWWCRGSPVHDKTGIIADGAIRSGKTISMSLSFVMWAMSSFSGQNFAMCGKTIGSFRRNVLFWLKLMLRSRGYSITDHRADNLLSGPMNNDKDKDVIVNLTIKADSETLYKVVRKGQKKYDNRYHVVATI